MVLAGVDGCKMGWIMIKYHYDILTYGTYHSFKELIDDNNDLQRILIDIPIGLSSSKTERDLESKMRAELKGRPSTVFNVPCRKAVYASSDDNAKTSNIKVEGKSLSIQSLSLRDKIKQVDLSLRNSYSDSVKIYESHPELCFKYLNPERSVVLTSKLKKDGSEFRLKILEQYHPSAKNLYENILSQTKRSEVKKDDILDALCLLITNKLAGRKELSFLKNKHPVDDKGIEMKIAYYLP